MAKHKSVIPTLTAVIPVFNEEGILQSSVVGLREQLGELGYSFEIVLAENGSTDKTIRICADLAKKYREVQTFSISEPNYGRALKEGILRSHGKFIVCDEIDLGDIDFYERAIEQLIEDKADLVVGSKLAQGSEDKRPMIRHVATATYNFLLRTMFQFSGTDTHGMKAFSREALVGTVGRCVIDKDVFASELVIRAEQEKHRVVEIPVSIAEKRAPSINLASRVPNVIRNLVKLYSVMRLVK